MKRTVLFLFVLLIGPRLSAQTGAITGRIITDDGAPLAGVTVFLNTVNAMGANDARQDWRVATGDKGEFKFTNLSPRVYRLGVFGTKGYVLRVEDARQPRRVGDDITLTLVRGGVITGRVTTANGEPMTGARVSVLRVRDAEGQPAQRPSAGRWVYSDDRGVYRLYGLAPGGYVVVANNASFNGQPYTYEGDTQTFHPSASLETATEVSVTSGGEVTGIDIRYRGIAGRRITGTVIGLSAGAPGASVVAISKMGVFYSGNAAARGENEPAGFELFGLTEGEYEITARQFAADGFDSASAPRRVVISGADIGGVELRLAPLAAIAGRVVVEPAAGTCAPARKSGLSELVVSALAVAPAAESSPFSGSLQPETAANEQGQFLLTGLNAGRYALRAQLPGDQWFIKAITASALPARTNAADLSRGLTLKAGERLSGVTITVAEGAAEVRGRLPAAAGKGAGRVRVHLLPAEAGSADDLLRYAETLADSNGAFRFGNLAPGKYWALARTATSDPVGWPMPSPVAADPAARATLRRAAETQGVTVELRPCQKINDLLAKPAAP